MTKHEDVHRLFHTWVCFLLDQQRCNSVSLSVRKHLYCTVIEPTRNIHLIRMYCVRFAMVAIVLLMFVLFF